MSQHISPEFRRPQVRSSAPTLCLGQQNEPSLWVVRDEVDGIVLCRQSADSI